MSSVQIQYISTINDCSRSLPRVGMRTALAWRGGQVAWYGRGPYECYPDRKTAAHVGRYACAVEDMHVPYIVPGRTTVGDAHILVEC